MFYSEGDRFFCTMTEQIWYIMSTKENKHMICINGKVSEEINDNDIATMVAFGMLVPKNKQE